MGTVYAAHGPDLDRKVAIKVLHAGLAAQDSSSDQHAPRLSRQRSRHNVGRLVTELAERRKVGDLQGQRASGMHRGLIRTTFSGREVGTVTPGLTVLSFQDRSLARQIRF